MRTDEDWPAYLGDSGSSQYSALDQINVDNVGELELAWTYRSGDADPEDRTQIQCNPIVVDGVLYGTSPGLKLFALNAASGEELFSIDLHAGFDERFDVLYVSSNTPGVVFENLLIVGHRASENLLRCPAISAPSICAMAISFGASTPSPIPASSGTTRGPRTRGNDRAVRTPGRG